MFDMSRQLKITLESLMKKKIVEKGYGDENISFDRISI